MSTITASIPVSMAQFKQLLVSLSPEYSLCVRGRHAIGKSESVYQAAEELRSDFYKTPENCTAVVKAFGGKIKTPKGWVDNWNYDMGVPVLERRLSQMTEGDIIGLPFKNGRDTFDADGHRTASASTMFKPCDWLINSTLFPVVLFLDERNRALDGVKQAVFQLTDSKAFYGHHLHEETRIIIAENDGDEYQVQQCDPAEISRCCTVTLSPTPKDWINYAIPRCHQATIEFIQQNENLLEHTGMHEPNKKYPDRRSWFKLDQEAQRLNLFADADNHLFYTLAGSFIGVEAAAKFVKFVKEHYREVSAEDILTNWDKAKKRLAGKNTISAEQYVECASKIELYLKTKLKDQVMNMDQVENIAKFMKDTTPEVMMTIWSQLCVMKEENIVATNAYIQPWLSKVLVNEDVSNIDNASREEVENKLATKTTSKPTKRGAKVKTPK